MLFFSNSFLISVLSITDFFPQVSLNFAGGASMDLRPQDYLIQHNPIVSIQASIFSRCFTLFGFYIPYVILLINTLMNQCKLQNGGAVWCIGFQKIKGQGVTILGGISI
jgi:hypothetical protein